MIRLNILYIHTHDTGRYIEPYGYQVPTPNLMELAREGTVFRHAYCAGPTCSPSRAGLLTGMAPHSCGMMGLAHRGFVLDDYKKHLAQFLKEKGYETVLCGMQHEAPKTEMLGYDYVLADYQGEEVVEDFVQKDLENARKVAEYLTKPKEKPFFVSFGMQSTHRIFPDYKASVDPDYVMPPFPLYDTQTNREDMAAYITSAKVADDCVGIVLDALEKSGLEDETIVLFTTDHGIAFPRMKCNLYDTGIGVALIFKYPGNQRGGKSVDTLISQIDVFPTLCDILNIERPHWLQGTSFLPVLENKREKIRDEIYSEVTFHAAYEPMRCIRTERYKLIKYFEPHGRPVPANIDDGLSKEFLVSSGYLESTISEEMLFDLYLDPVERENRIGEKEYEHIYEDLSQRLRQWMEDTDDPLLHGKVEKPEGAIVNKINCMSAEEKDYE